MPNFMPDAAPAKITEVGQALNHLADEQKILSERLSQLETVLHPVLADRKDGPSGQETTSTPEPVRVPLAQTIHDYMLITARMNTQLVSILNRLEL